MKMKTNLLAFVFLLSLSHLFGQMNKYEYKREIKGTMKLWNSIVLPDKLYSKAKSDLSDIRIYGITAANDTVEAPYFYSTPKLLPEEAGVGFNLINQTKNEKGYFFTFEIQKECTVNEISLNFEQKNYDWRIKLEGSENQNEWFTITDNYRILSIKNDITDYQFNKIRFAEAKYRFYRLCVPAKEKPRLTKTQIVLHRAFPTNTNQKTYSIKQALVTQDKQKKLTIIDLDLGIKVPVSALNIGIKDSIDYYRPVIVEYLADSFKTEKSWYYNYNELTTTNILSSVDKHDFEFSQCMTNKLRITIYNNDNQALHPGSFQVKGNTISIITRITAPGRYYLCYGNKDAEKPEYDIAHFKNEKIVTDLGNVNPGEEEFVNPDKSAVAQPLFVNKIWLWAIMGVIILLLGWFTLKMIKKAE